MATIANPLQEVRSALEQLLSCAAFNYDAGATRQLVSQCQKVLRRTTPVVAHERAVGIYHYDAGAGAYVPADEEQAKDSRGELRPGYEYLFKQPAALIAH